MQNEKLLIQRCLKHDERALGNLYNNFSGKMYGICLRYAKNKMDADDLLHDGFIKVLKNLQAYRGEGSFEGWMRKIMVNSAINFYRKKT
ncbi:MAG: RNA polymerase subunit sigma-70, partial [Bacteroidetes bacterium]